MKRLNLMLVIINSDYRWYLKQNVYSFTKFNLKSIYAYYSFKV